ncbi:MAG: methionine--tRNA ligase [Myxococcales bacterium]
MAARTLVTMALPYANGSLHLGHLVEAVQTDVYVRALRAAGEEVAFIGADDTHGTPIEVNAARAGVPAEQFVARFHTEHSANYRAFEVLHDIFYTTNSPENEEHVVRIFRTLDEAGAIERRPVEQLYCEIDRRFLPDRYVKGECPKCGAKDQYGDACEVCGSTYEPTDLKNPYCALCKEQGRGEIPPVRRSSMHYFVRLSKYQEFLRGWTAAKGHLQPEVKRSIDGWLSEPLKDWDVSRDAPYFGFRIPGETDKYFYVWLDAPVGYLSSTDRWCKDRGDKVERWWSKDADTDIVHFIGKDIVYFHTLFWPAMLHASGWKVPAHVHVHGMLTVDGAKMSKTRGNFFTVDDYLGAGLDPEWLRYYFASNLGPTPSDIDLSLPEMKNRVNGELLNNVGNLANRALSVVWKSFDGKLGKLPASPEDLFQVSAIERKVAGLYRAIDTRAAIQEVLALSSLANARLQEKQPWKVIKTDRAAAHAELTLAVNVARVCARLLAPVVPTFAKGVEEQTGAPLRWGDSRWLEETAIREPKPLVRRVEDADLAKLSGKFVAGAEAPPPQSAPAPAVAVAATVAEISIDEFGKMDLRAGKVLACERIPKSDKLLKLTIDLGEGAPRTVVSGVAQAYAPEELVGKTVAVVANLPKKPLRGVESHGMVLFATGGKRGLVAVEIGEDIPPGAKVK